MSDDARDQATGATGGRPRGRIAVTTHPARPLLTGFTVSVGVLLAAALAVTIANVATVLVSLVLALFIALGLNPAVLAMERRGLRRPIAITIVAVVFLGLVALIVAFVIPTVIRQAIVLVQSLPATIAQIESTDWFAWLEATLGTDLSAALQQGLGSVIDLSSFLAVSGGLLRAGAGALGAISSGFLVVVLTLYFLGSMDAMKKALAGLVPAYRRETFSALTDEITGSVGGVIAGAVILSAINATVVFVLQLVIGSTAPFLMAVVAFFITLVPLAGSLIFLAVGTVAALLFASPTGALVFLIGYFAYIQIEAYFVTPRIMGRAVAVPGILVIVGAMAGATLFGLLGVLVAIPITASILIILRKVVMPRQDARTQRPEI